MASFVDFDILQPERYGFKKRIDGSRFHKKKVRNAELLEIIVKPGKTCLSKLLMVAFV